MSHALLLTVASLASQGPKHEEIHQLWVNHNQETFRLWIYQLLGCHCWVLLICINIMIGVCPNMGYPSFPMLHHDVSHSPAWVGTVEIKGLRRVQSCNLRSQVRISSFVRSGFIMITRGYPLVNIQKAIENGHLSWIYPLKMVIFHSYVSLPEGRCWFSRFGYCVECTYKYPMVRNLLPFQRSDQHIPHFVACHPLNVLQSGGLSPPKKTSKSTCSLSHWSETYIFGFPHMSIPQKTESQKKSSIWPKTGIPSGIPLRSLKKMP